MQINIVSVLLLGLLVAAGRVASAVADWPGWAIAGAVGGLIVGLAPRVAKQWEHALRRP